ncbi:HalOD1 output domain-containing protein [Halomicrobium salinisoli]|uniref:HalOD1 output domain-containing protein n=1 Tax=Halomicrobium salinisoli TaxID=2878391 RepID=UPI001CF0807A|nr:HalOD1 output domain-containing protein [Halomicrobium salinisoli]
MDTRTASGQAFSDGGGPIADVLWAVAEAEDRDPTELPPLGDAIDPDAFERLLSESSTLVRVSFEYAGHVIEARSDGTVRIRDDSEE